jgi:hypothetical protein
MRMRRLALFAALPVLALCSLLSPHALAQGTLDQSNTATPLDVFATTMGFPVIAQTFTAGLTGQLATATVQLGASTPPSAATVQLLATDASGAPTGAPLASGTVTATAPFRAGTFVPVTFAPAATVTAGQLYALVLFPTPGPIYWSFTDGDAYPRGAAFTGSVTGAPYTQLPSDWDFDFQTFVTPPASTAIPPPAPIVISNPLVTLGIALTGCGNITPSTLTAVNQFQAIPVTAVPCPGSVFVGWTGGPCNGTRLNPCDIAPTGLTTITATFAP